MAGPTALRVRAHLSGDALREAETAAEAFRRLIERIARDPSILVRGR